MTSNTFKKQLSAIRHMTSTIVSRATLAARMGKSFGSKRDIYEALGYNKELVYDDFYARYRRQDIATRIVEAPVKATWRKKPDIVELGKSNVSDQTEFEKQWELLVKEKHIYQCLNRVDILSGIGQYAVLLLGLDDNAESNMPIERANEILYLALYSQDNAVIDKWETDIESPRYGFPLTYKINMRKGGGKSSTVDVHYSRVLHIAEGALENDIYGSPRLENVFNRLQDLELVSGGSSEMFWRGAYPGMAFEADADADFTQTGEALEDEIETYIHGLKRYMKLQGIKANTLATQVASPKDHVSILLDLISGGTGIPKRILIGSERGELASSQDETNWESRVDERRMDYVEPMILRKFIDTLIQFGVLATPAQGYDVVWPDLMVKTDEQKVNVAKTKAEALSIYSNAMGADMIIPPNFFLHSFLQLSQDEIDQINIEVGQFEVVNEE